METKISEEILKNSNLDICFELERLFIGVPRHIVGTDLPENCVWADGSFISFANYPKMKYAYDNGWFSGMMLTWDADEEEQKKNLGMYRPDAAEPTGLFVPNLTNVFLRCWTPAQTDETAGMWHRDEIRNISGTSGDLCFAYTGSDGQTFSGGALTTHIKSEHLFGHSNKDIPQAYLSFDASRIVPTGAQNVPQHVWMPIVIYSSTLS